MLATVPDWVVDTGIIAGCITAVITAVVAVKKSGLWRRFARDPATKWAQEVVEHAVEPKFEELRGEIAKDRRNGDKRIEAVEVTVGEHTRRLDRHDDRITAIEHEMRGEA